MSEDSGQKVEELRSDINLKIIENRHKLKQADEFYLKKHESHTRERIAYLFVRGYFLLFVLVIVGVPLYNFLTVRELKSQALAINLNDILLTFSSIVGSALGFVIGYYFKAKE